MPPLSLQLQLTQTRLLHRPWPPSCPALKHAEPFAAPLLFQSSFLPQLHHLRVPSGTSLSGVPQPRKNLRLSFVKASAPANATEYKVTKDDVGYMRRAVELAKKAAGHTSPNPMVGCVIVKNGQIIGEGYHPKAGEPHAEVFALRAAGSRAQGATAYVSLEPCNHFGRTPPCSQALVRGRVKRVIVGMVDPNPQVSGKGVETLRRAGIEVVTGVEEALCQSLNDAFVHRMLYSKPLSILRYTMSLDGKSVGSAGAETDPTPGSYYSKLLAANDVVVVLEAALYSDPSLLSAEPGAKQPLRVVLAQSLDMPVGSRVFDMSAAPTLVITQETALVDDLQLSARQGQPPMEVRLREKGIEVLILKELDLDNILDIFYQRGANSVLWDSQAPKGSQLEDYLAKWVFREDAVQKVVCCITPEIIGDKGKAVHLTGGKKILTNLSTTLCGSDVVVEGKLTDRG